MPSSSDVARLYHELSRLGARAVGRPARWRYGSPSPEELVVLACEASRYDARLLWIIVELLATRYDRLDPLRLRRTNQAARWPQALGVAFEFARQVRPDAELTDVAEFVLRRVPRARGEQFFIGAHALAGPLMFREAAESLAEYKRWGYLGTEVPVSKELGVGVVGTMAAPERRNLLRRLSARGPLRLADYVEALQGRASVRQAARDLASADFLVRRGRTRGARYWLKE